MFRPSGSDRDPVYKDHGVVRGAIGTCTNTADKRGYP